MLRGPLFIEKKLLWAAINLKKNSQKVLFLPVFYPKCCEGWEQRARITLLGVFTLHLEPVLAQ
jgi:hypothetical protein